MQQTTGSSVMLSGDRMLFRVRTSCASGLRVIAMTSPIFNLLRRMYGAAAIQACQKAHVRGNVHA